jgi:hypothetical protein
MKMRTADERESTVHRSTCPQPATSASHRSFGALCCHNLAHDIDDFIVQKLGFSQEDDTVFKASEKFSLLFPGQQPVSELCLGCICEAISNCNRSLGCNGDVCGLFRITWAYWADAGKPVIAQDHADNEGGEGQ